MTIEKHTITNFHISFTKGTFDIQLFKKENQGSTLYTFNSELFEIIWYASDHEESKILDFIKKLHHNLEKNLEGIYNAIGGVFEIFIHNKNNNKLLVFSDLYGVNGSFYLTKNEQQIFFLNFQNFDKLQVPLLFDKLGIQTHFAFGYQVAPFPLPYKNICRIQGGKRYTFEYNVSLQTTDMQLRFPKNRDTFSLKEGLNATKNLFFGATAGKDSLALLSQITKVDKEVKAGNFGNIYAADVIQGKEIAIHLDIPYSHSTLCDANEFEYYAQQIAMISGGLATVSYVDMLKFVEKNIPKNYSFVMGEAGECVRMFFNNDTDLAKAMHNYITPKEFLEETLLSDYDDFKKVYPIQISQAVAENYTGTTNAETLINFYRKGRLPGNFGNRHKIIAAYRNKMTPFLHENFIKATHKMSINHFKNDKIHEQIIYNNNQDLLQYFKNPIQSETSVQDWHHRIQYEIGEKLYNLLEKHIHVLKTVFDTEKVLQLAKKQQKSPNRGIYFLFRILSMAIFVYNINKEVGMNN